MVWPVAITAQAQDCGLQNSEKPYPAAGIGLYHIHRLHRMEPAPARRQSESALIGRGYPARISEFLPPLWTIQRAPTAHYRKTDTRQHHDWTCAPPFFLNMHLFSCLS